MTAAVLGYFKNFHHKYFSEGCNAGTNPAMMYISAFSNVLYLNNIIFLPRNLKPTKVHPRYSSISELLSCIVLLVFPLCKFTSGPVMPVRAEYLFCLSVL